MVKVPRVNASNLTEQGRHGFDFRDAFSRNIGWVTELEQEHLRNKKVGIAGMGGVGGAHLLALARLGVGGFHIADLDQFETANFNRQVGAGISTLGRGKTDVMSEMAKDINPELDITVFENGVEDWNIDIFLDGVDLFVDGIDFFVLDIRAKIFARCAELGIPAITAAPIGMSAAWLVFMPDGMTFEQFFRLNGLTKEQQYVNFFLGLTPSALHRSYLVDSSRLDLAGQRGPSTSAGVNLCAGVVAAQAVKIMLGRGKVRAAPCYHQFDAYLGKWKQGRLWFGNRGPLQSLKRHLAYKGFAQLSRDSRPAEPPAAGTEVEQILDLARWAPSGDNSQPWQFEIMSDERVIVHVQAEGEAKDIYDYNNGQPTLLSAGFLLETMRIAASGFARDVQWSYLGKEGSKHRIAVDLPRSPTVKEDPLISYITIRSVDRRPYRLEKLTTAQTSELEKALGEKLAITWHETFDQRWRMVRINAQATDIRLSLRAAYDIHRRIIDWENRFSRDGVPAAAIGLDAITLRIMRWAMGEWRRIDVMNRFFAGTVLPRIQLDLLPGIFSAAHFSVEWRENPDSKDEIMSLLRAGQSLQRFWLAATRMGLVIQPALAPLCFAHYGREQGTLNGEYGIDARSVRLAGAMSALVGRSAAGCVFMGRIGRPRPRVHQSRSIRRAVQNFIQGEG